MVTNIHKMRALEGRKETALKEGMAENSFDEKPIYTCERLNKLRDHYLDTA